LRANRLHASTHRMLAISQWQLGRHDQARATVAELMRIEPNLTVTRWLDRSPSSGYPIGTLCADTLREAGVPV
jgi:adenylate cyclase